MALCVGAESSGRQGGTQTLSTTPPAVIQPTYLNTMLRPYNLLPPPVVWRPHTTTFSPARHIATTGRPYSCARYARPRLLPPPHRTTIYSLLVE
jgi:hypothetical protein